MDSTSLKNTNAISFTRIGKVLEYIHSNLGSSLSLEHIAEQSCWSRWQLQRVFQAHTGLTVANYIRDLKLSGAAERLLDSNDRIIDIAIDLGFNSEVTFSRAFKQRFSSSPSHYRKRGTRVDLKKPIEFSLSSDSSDCIAGHFIEVRIDSKQPFMIKGVHTTITGLFSLSPDFSQKVPKLWSDLEKEVQNVNGIGRTLGVIDTTGASFDTSNLEYWAGVELTEQFELPLLPSLISEHFQTLHVPEQTYAVVKHQGPIALLPNTLQWLIMQWLPSSGYRGIDGYELELYPENYQSTSLDAQMEYWIPIQKV